MSLPPTADHAIRRRWSSISTINSFAVMPFANVTMRARLQLRVDDEAGNEARVQRAGIARRIPNRAGGRQLS
ncbi:MAG: hypothetical protein HOP13_16590 [Alphaproteobacteria bacterium]|nr:hypothetical protein [Alphaproteobacteria bacterium]